MNYAIDFLRTYYREIFELILLITSFIFLIIRKRPVEVIDTIREVIIRLLPLAINEAEKSELKGDAKLKFALQLVKGMAAELGYSFDDHYMQFAKENIEVILSTPQKKGINYGCKKKN